MGRALLPDLLQDLSLKLHIVSRNKLDVVVPAFCRVLPSLGNFLFLSLLHPSRRGVTLNTAALEPSLCTWAAPRGFSSWYWELDGWEDEGQAQHVSLFIFKNVCFLEPILTDALSTLNGSTSCGRTVYEEKCIGSNKHLPLKFMSKKSMAALSQLTSRAVVLRRLPLLKFCSFLLLASLLHGWILGDLNQDGWSFLPHEIADRNMLWYYSPDNFAVRLCLSFGDGLSPALGNPASCCSVRFLSALYMRCGDTSAPFMPGCQRLLGRTRSTYCEESKQGSQTSLSF